MFRGPDDPEHPKNNVGRNLKATVVDYGHEIRKSVGTTFDTTAGDPDLVLHFDHNRETTKSLYEKDDMDIPHRAKEVTKCGVDVTETHRVSGGRTDYLSLNTTVSKHRSDSGADVATKDWYNETLTYDKVPHTLKLEKYKHHLAPVPGVFAIGSA